MFHIEKMREEMRAEVVSMVLDFYHSDAVDHVVEAEVLEQTFTDAVSPDPVLTGYVLMEDDHIVGFAYVTVFYACEVGGRCMMFEELYLKAEARGRGYGSRFFQAIMDLHPEIQRFRLEVTKKNESAARLYKKLGFTYLSYNQMVKDR